MDVQYSLLLQDEIPESKCGTQRNQNKESFTNNLLLVVGEWQQSPRLSIGSKKGNWQRQAGRRGSRELGGGADPEQVPGRTEDGWKLESS